MNRIERAELECSGTIKRIEAFVSSSTCLELTKNHLVQPRQVYVDVVNSKNASKVISELIGLVKISEVNDAYSSKVTVKQGGSSLTKFYVSYHQKVLFFSKRKERITKDIAIYLIKGFQ